MKRLRVYGRAFAILTIAPAAGFIRLFWKEGVSWLKKTGQRA